MRVLQAGLYVTIANVGLPDLETLLTNNASEVADFLHGWDNDLEFGLATEAATLETGASWTTLVQIAARERVLLYDRTPPKGHGPRPLPECLAAFLRNQSRVFYGRGLVRDARRLAFELQVVIRGVDLALRAWPETMHSRSLTSLYNDLLDTKVFQTPHVHKTDWAARPLSGMQLTSAAQQAHLSWAVGHHLAANRGGSRENWFLSRADLHGDRAFNYHARDGLPSIAVLYTSDPAMVTDFLWGWAGESHLGLDLVWTRSSNSELVRRTALLMLSAGSRVLVFDFVPLPGESALGLPSCLRRFLQNERRTFYGARIAEAAARLAFEFRCTVRVIGLSERAWPQLPSKAGTETLAHAVFGVKSSAEAVSRSNWEWRPLSQRHLDFCVRRGYLAWAIARRCIDLYGHAHDDWLLTESDFFQAARQFGAYGFANAKAAAASYKRLVIAAHVGLPELELLYTGNEASAADFLNGWEGNLHIGLDMEWRPKFSKAALHSRTALLQLAAGPRVLIFDLVPLRGHATRQLPACLRSFLQDHRRTFYGMGMFNDLVRLHAEFGVFLRGADFALRPWKDMPLGGGLAGLANRILGTEVRQDRRITLSNWEKRPLSNEQLQYAAEDAYLSWAVAEEFRRGGQGNVIDAQSVFVVAQVLVRRLSSWGFAPYGLAAESHIRRSTHKRIPPQG
eukprot:CAMPEP_0170217810 /NCGR_PEP_ID=MMETSP0116_2-20130129/8572_1 /TAXON_ID=400756 /ORGANISM="Durinskia baltica, Strain CSIRO CS-38" /LENGTH=679 /DNA_ID=CAMNT_0010468447 /DNA_START=44 /DNA_END=2080 /DNA_ORIENTATION=-